MKGRLSGDGMLYEVRGPKGGVVCTASCRRRSDGIWEYEGGLFWGTFEAETEEEARGRFREIMEDLEKQILGWRMWR